jgi:hypothetical protein
MLSQQLEITVAASSKAWTVLARSNTDIVGSNPTRSMDVCTFILFVLSCVQAEPLRRADPPSKESNRLCISLVNRKIRQGPTNGLYSLINKNLNSSGNQVQS